MAATAINAIPKVGGKAPAKDKLDALRAHMRHHRLQAYYVPSEDAHQSEYIAAWDGRRSFLTGFTGSAGFAVVLGCSGGDGGGGEAAAVWTDGRYFNQAEKQLDAQCWTLMRAGLPNTPKREEWLLKKLSPNDRLGVDPKLISGEAAKKLQEQLQAGKIELVPVEDNLVDAIWADRPTVALSLVKSLPVEYSGRAVEDKLQWLRAKGKSGKAILLSQLDEIAWLFNLRGSDIPFNPVFFAYAIVTDHEATLYVNEPSRLPTPLPSGVSVKPYDAVFEDVKTISDPIQVGSTCNWALMRAAAKPPLVKVSPIEVEKAIKNDCELVGFRQCHISDAAAVVKYLSWLQQELLAGRQVDECRGADRLELFRRESRECQGLSFDTISGSGPNGAIIHYKPEPATCAAITTHQMYLVDSGGQYLSGTTDITRTVHFGQPSAYERRCFTAVLKGVISLAQSIFPTGTKGIQLDAMARQHLWRLGLDYRHGTGHGVGHYLNVHEGPHSISFRAGPEDVDLRAGMTVTDEPGYYEDGNFGIRIENVLVVVEKQTEFGFVKCLGFDTITLVPIQASLIDTAMLTEGDVEWINRYHQECWDKVSGLLEGRPKEWLFDATRPLKA